MSGLGLGLDQNSDITKPVLLVIKLTERVQRYCISQELHDGALGRSMLVIAPQRSLWSLISVMAVLLEGKVMRGRAERKDLKQRAGSDPGID